MSTLRAGIVLVAVVVMLSYFGFTKQNPFSNPFTFTATFQSVNNLKVGSPVRIAGVEVGKVKLVKPLADGSGAGEVTMAMKDEGLPIHKDAQLKIRPRIFLEGNFFVDVRPGSPSAPIIEKDDTIPINQTATPVQFGQVLTALQSDTREDLRTFLAEYSLKGLKGGGARGFNRSIKYWEPAYKNTALANEATLGRQVGDLTRLLRGQQKTLGALARDPDDLRNFITNFNTTAAAFAREDDALEAAVPALRDVFVKGPPAFRSLRSSLPSLSAFARDALPGTRSSVRTLEESTPFIRQLRLLFREEELKGLVRDLRPTVPALARSNRSLVPFLEQQRALARCTNRVLLPFSKTPIPNPDERDENNPNNDNSDEPFYKQAPRSLVGLAGESRISDANSPLFRVQFSGGNNTLFERGELSGETLVGQRPAQVSGTRPAKPDRRSPHRPGVPCETQEPPDLNAVRGGSPSQATFDVEGNPLDVVGQIPNIVDGATKLLPLERKEQRKELGLQVNALLDQIAREKKGQPAVDILSLSEEGQQRQLKKMGLLRNEAGRLEKREEAK